MNFSILSRLLSNIAPTDSSNSNNQTEDITILYAVIPTPASAGLVFDRQGAT